MSEKKHGHSKVESKVAKHVHKRGPKVKIHKHGKLKSVSFGTRTPKWGGKYSFTEQGKF